MSERVIVAGLGAWGSSTAYQLASHGYDVVALDRYAPPHDFGSSHGLTRVDRELCNESAAVLPLAVRSREIYHELQERFGVELTRCTGGLYVGPADHPQIARTLAGYEEKGVAFELLDAARLRRRHPAFELADGEVAIYQSEDRVLLPERIITTFQRAAEAAGAELRRCERVLAWEQHGDVVQVSTERERLEADHLVIAAGRWTAVLAGCALPVRPERQVSVWFDTAGRPEIDDPRHLPIFVSPTAPPARSVYGVPGPQREGYKVALHRGGAVGDPQELPRTPGEADVQAVRDALATRLPALAELPVLRAQVCWYTVVPDETHVIGWHPDCDRVALAAGCNGVGMKPAPGIGDALLDLLQGGGRYDLSAFSASRFA